MIICGGYHTVIQNEKKEIYVCGNNRYGQLGLGDNVNRNIFEKLDFDFGEIKNIACGENHTIIQNDKNEIYACGYNNYSQLGLGDNYNRNKFEKVESNFGEIKKIVCGYGHIIIQNEKNELHVCGYNECGQLGLGNNEHKNKFEKVEHNLGEIKNIVCGNSHTVIQNEKNEVYVCGYNYFYGQLGLGDNMNRNKFEKVKKNFGKIKNIVCGGYHTVIQNEKNEIYVCGANCHGQLGLGDNRNRNKFEKVEYDFGKIKNVACGNYHTIIQNEKNEIYVCGDDGYGQLGMDNNKRRDKFEKVDIECGEIKNITCGNSHTIIQNAKNEIYVCGHNYYGQLGLNNYEFKYIFEKVNIDDIFEEIYDFKLNLDLNTEEIVL